MDKTLTLRITGDASGLRAEVVSADRGLDGLGKSGADAGRRVAGGMDQANRSTQALGASSRSVTDLIKRSIAGFSTAYLVREYIRAADSAANMAAKVSLVSSSQAQAVRTQRELYEISQRTAAPLEATVSLYTRMASSLRDVGASTTETLALTETINKAFAVSGATAQETASASLQLSQAFASGTLRGEEFNAVNEAAPRLMQALADSLGVPRGALRALAEEGKLTGDVLRDAFSGEQAARIAAEFEKLPNTVGRSLQRLQNAVVMAVGEFDQNTGISTILADSLVYLTGVVEVLPGKLQAAGGVWAEVFGRMDDDTASAMGNIVEWLAQFGLGVDDLIAGANELLILPQSIATMATIVIGELDKLRISGVEKFELLVVGAKGVWLAIEESATGLGIDVQLIFARAIDGVIRRYADLVGDIAGLAAAVGMDETAADLNAFVQQLQAAAQVEALIQAQAEASRQAYAARRAELVAEIATIKERAATQRDAADAAIQASLDEREAALKALDAKEALAVADDVYAKGKPRAIALTKEQIAAASDYAKALAKLEDITASLRGEVGGPLAKVEAEHVKKLREIAAAGAAAIEASREMAQGKQAEATVQQAVTEAIDAQTAAYDRNRRAAEVAEFELANRPSLIEEATQSLRDEIAAMQMSNEERAVQEALLTAASRAKRDYANATRETIGLTAEETATIEAQTRELFRNGEALQGLRSGWEDFTGGLAAAAAQGGDSVKRWWRALIDDMKRQLIQSGLLKLFGSIFNTGGARAGTSLLGSLFSGGATASNGTGLFGTLGDTFSGWLSSNASTIIPGIAAVAGAAYGFGNRGSSNGSGGSLAAGAAYGYAGYALGTVGVGAYLGATAGAATGVAGAATSGALSGAAGAAGAIPVVGWIVAAIAAIDAITGGKVFGSRYRPESSTSSISIGADGGDASMSLTEVRNRSLFRGRQWRTTSQDPGDEARAAAQSLYDSVSDAMTGAAQALAIDVPPVIDAAIRTVVEYDKKGKVKASQIFVDILGRSFKEADAESAAKRIIAEGLIATVDAAAREFAAQSPSLAKPITEAVGKIFDAGMNDFEGGSRRGGGIGGGEGIGVGIGGAASTMSEVQKLAERWRGNAQTLLDGAQFLVAAMQAMQADGGLLGLGHSLTETTDLVEELARGEETLTQAFARLMASTALLRDAVDLMGVSMDTTGADFVKLAQDIVDAAGGLEQAQALWANYFDTFYSLQERSANALDSILEQRAAALGDIGLDSNITNDQFRAAFEAALPTLTPEQVVEWLQAGAAIRAAADAQAAYNAALDEAAQPMRDYEAAVRALAEEAMSASLTDYQREIRAINAARDEEVARLNELARAAGMQAAAEDDLAAIHVIAARKAAEALAKLREYGRDLVQQFNGGSQLDLLNEQIAAIEAGSNAMYQSQVDGLGAVDDAARSTYEAQVAAQQRIREFLDNLILGPLGGLRPRDQLAEGQRQFDALMERALAGDTDAMSALPQLADQLLRIGQQVFASGDPYFSLRDSIMQALEQVAALPATAPTGVPGGTGGGSVQVDASSDLQALYEERDRLLAEQTAAERLALAQQISAVIRDLILATREPLETIAADLNVNIADLVAALGVNLDEMTAANANSLGDIAASMGVNLAELAANVGVDLGSLADRQSLLNDALEAQINELPADQRDELAPLLQAVEEAAALGDTAGVETGVSALEEAVNALAPSLRDQLAPYFDGVAPVDYTQLDALSYIDAQTASAAASLTAHTGLLERIANNLRESNSAAGLPAYATGTTYVPRTGPALIHEGEMILPAPVARFLRQPQGGGGASNGAVQALREELRALREENAKLLQLIAGRLGEVKGAVDQGATKQATAIDRQTLVMGARR